MSGLMASELIRRYYEEADALKRRAILEESLEKGEEPEANQMRKALWDCRYKGKLDKTGEARADGMMRLWMTLKFYSGARMGIFSRKRNQKELRKLLKELGYTETAAKGSVGEQVLKQECYHGARVYMVSCSEDKRYGTTLMGLMSISKEKIQEKIAKDTVMAAKLVPEELQMEEELRIFSEASIQAYQDLFPGDPGLMGMLE